MVFKQFLSALAVSTVVFLCFYLIARKKNRKTGYWQPFLIIFAGTWAGGVWLAPATPDFSGFNIIAYAATGIFLGAALTVIANRRPPEGRRETLEKLEAMENQKNMEKAAYFTLNIFLWLVFALLVAAVVTRYLRIRF